MVEGIEVAFCDRGGLGLDHDGLFVTGGRIYEDAYVGVGKANRDQRCAL